MRSPFSALVVVLALGAASHAVAGERFHYVAYAAGLRVLDIGLTLRLDANAYDVDMTLRTVGMLGAFVDGDAHAVAHGHWRGLVTLPIAYDSRGHWNGEARQTSIDYIEGQPVVRTLAPPNEAERETVAPALQANTLDSLSAMAALLHTVATTGRCEGQARLFDGRRLSDITVRTGGPEILAATDRSSFQGAALRCDFEGRLLAGFRREDDRARAARPQHGSAWLAAATKGAPLVPVRIQFETRFFGSATMYLAP